MACLSEIIDALSAPASLFQPAADGAVRCLACSHTCLIKPGQRGICQMRFNRGGELRAPWGYVAGVGLDPIEKKPFYHFLPGSQAFTFGMLGCNLKCDFCQNWVTSQALRDPASDGAAAHIQPASAEELVRMTLNGGAASVVSSYNEPLITIEWALEIFSLARTHGLRTAMISNGMATPEALRALQPLLDGFKVDLKCMQENSYRQLGGKLQPVLDAIQLAHALGMWVEVVTLLIPHFNDSDAELADMAKFLVSVSPELPWHVTGFYPTYKRGHTPPTSSDDLARAADIGRTAGLKYVYAGNRPGQVGSLENTFCPNCNSPVIQRRGFVISAYSLTGEGRCPQCANPIAGVWSQDPASVRLGLWGLPGQP